MDCYLKSINYDIWYIVMHGDIIPRKKIDDGFVEKVHEELDEKDKIMISKSAKAKNYLIYGLERMSVIVLIKHLVHLRYGKF